MTKAQDSLKRRQQLQAVRARKGPIGDRLRLHDEDMLHESFDGIGHPLVQPGEYLDRIITGPQIREGKTMT